MFAVALSSAWQLGMGMSAVALSTACPVGLHTCAVGTMHCLASKFKRCPRAIDSHIAKPYGKILVFVRCT
jgi:hypothetical protein